MNHTYEGILKLYGQVLSSVDIWFRRCIATVPEQIVCSDGCSGCCRSLFDITLLDACYLRSGFEALDPQHRRSVQRKAEKRLTDIKLIWPDFSIPYILNARPDTVWQQIMDDADETPCVLLGDNGRCLTYEYRPMTCRLHGIPLIDLRGEVIDESSCTLNFKDKNIPLPLVPRHDFTGLFEDEMTCFRLLTLKLLKQQFTELDTLVPAALVMDFQHFHWQEWLDGVYPINSVVK